MNTEALCLHSIRYITYININMGIIDIVSYVYLWQKRFPRKVYIRSYLMGLSYLVFVLVSSSF